MKFPESGKTTFQSFPNTGNHINTRRPQLAYRKSREVFVGEKCDAHAASVGNGM